MSDDGVWHIDKDEAAAAVKAAAFEVTDTESSDFGRVLVHCRMSFTGADWDLAGVLDLIERSDDRAWFPGDIFDHDLAVLADGRLYRFAAKAPS